MTSQINYTAIDENYPVAGKDNDSQGFRDNFSSIKAGLSVAKSEISSLESSAVLKHSLNGASAVDNNLNGSSINNGFYNNFHGTSHSQTVSSSTSIDVSAASCHIFMMLNAVNFTFRNWPTAGHYAKIRIHFFSNGSGVYEPLLYSEGGGTIITDTDYPTPLFVSQDGKHQVIEAWSVDNGENVYIKYLGKF